MPKLTYSYPPIWKVLNDGKSYQPFDWQAQHLHAQVDAGYPRIILPCGRRSGKSRATVAEVAREVVKPAVEVKGVMHSPIVYIIGPTTEAAMRVWEPVWDAFVPSDDGSYVPPLGFLYADHDKSRGIIILKGGARIYRKTADDPRSLQGERLTLAVPDEAQDINEDAWENVMPGLADSGGRLIAIGVPKGKGRFRSYYRAGQDGDPQFYSASVPTTANPIMTDRAREAGEEPEEYLRSLFGRDLTDAEFRRQYMAEWVEEDGLVFRGFDQCFTGHLETPRYETLEVGGKEIKRLIGGPYLMGLDLGFTNDWTVAYVIDVGRMAVVAKDRFHAHDSLGAGARIAKLYHEWECQLVHYDATGAGLPFLSIFRAEGMNTVPFIFSARTKAALVQTLASEIEHGRIILPVEDTVLRGELDLFEGSYSATNPNVPQYSAPKGYYDDSIMALGLAVLRAKPRNRQGASVVQKPYVTFSHHRLRRRGGKVRVAA